MGLFTRFHKFSTAQRMGIPATLDDVSHGVQTVGVRLGRSLAAIAAAGCRSVAYLTRAEGWREAIDTTAHTAQRRERLDCTVSSESRISNLF